MGIYLVLNLDLSCPYDLIKPTVVGLEVKRIFYISRVRNSHTASPPGNSAMMEMKVLNRSAPIVTRQRTCISHAA